MAIVVPIVSTWNAAGLRAAMRDIERAETGLQRMAGIGQGLGAVGRNMTVALTAPIAGIGIASVNTAAEFDVSMQSIRVNTDATAAEMTEAAELAKKFGRETIYSANDSADAMLELTKAGLTLDQVKAGGLAATLNLAATESMDLAEAGKIMAQTMNAYSISAEDANKVTDILAAGAVASTASVTDLSYGLKYVSSSAAQAGLDVDDTVTALASLNNAGLSASTAGTSLNQMLLGLQAPTAAAEQVMKDLGFSVTDASGEMKPMEQIIKDLDKATSDLSGPEKQAALKTMFNTRGMRAANILLEEGADGWAELNGQVTEAGVAQELADARMSGMAGSLERLKGSAETAALAIGDAMAPAVNAVAKALEGFLNWFTNLDKGMQTAIVTTLAVVAALGPLIWIIGSVISTITTLVAVIRTIATVIQVVKVSMAVMTGATTPIMLLIVAIAMLAVLLIMNWDKVLAFLKKAWDWIQKTVAAVWNAIWGTISGVMSSIWNFLVGIWNAIAGFFTGVWNAIFGTVSGAVKKVWSIIVSVFNTIKAFITSVLKAYFNIFKNVWTSIFNVIKGIIDTIKGIITSWINAVKAVIKTAMDLIKAIFQGDWDKVLEIIKSTITKVINAVKDLPGKILNALGNLGKLLFDKGKELITGLIDGIKSMIGAVGDAISNILPGGNMAVGGASVYYAPVLPGVTARGGSVAPALARDVTINISGDSDPYRTARVVKRAIEGYDVSQGRSRNQPLAVAW